MSLADAIHAFVPVAAFLWAILAPLFVYLHARAWVFDRVDELKKKIGDLDGGSVADVVDAVLKRAEALRKENLADIIKARDELRVENADWGRSLAGELDGKIQLMRKEPRRCEPCHGR